ncbi:cullin 2 domain-containing protein [Tanacetum coccineum]
MIWKFYANRLHGKHAVNFDHERILVRKINKLTLTNEYKCLDYLVRLTWMCKMDGNFGKIIEMTLTCTHVVVLLLFNDTEVLSFSEIKKTFPSLKYNDIPLAKKRLLVQPLSSKELTDEAFEKRNMIWKFCANRLHGKHAVNFDRERILVRKINKLTLANEYKCLTTW